MASTLNIVQDRVSRGRLAADPPDVSIVPNVAHIGPLDFHRASELIVAGHAAVYQVEAQLNHALPPCKAAAQ
jgi:NTE family protein